MTQSKYAKHNLTLLRELARKRGIKPAAGWKKEDFVSALVDDDKEHAPPEEMGDLPPVAEAPDETAEYQPPTAPPAAPKPPPPPPKPEDVEDIPPENRPREPKRYKLMNDVTWVNANGAPIKLLAGRIMADNEYDIAAMKAKGCVFVEERVFKARGAR